MILQRFLRKHWGILVLAGLFFFIQACSKTESVEDKEDLLLAQVYNTSLFLSDLKGLTPLGSSPEDSLQIVNTFMENWIRESLLMHEAEKNVPSSLNIDELVRDYRASLIRHNYEKILVELQLDSTITQAELYAHYEENKDQYRLDDPILRCYFIKIPEGIANESDLSSWWRSNKEEDYKRMVDFCSKNATVYMLNDSTWYRKDDLALHLPKSLINLNNISKNREYNVHDDNYHYYLKVLETLASNEYAPFPYIEDQARKLILHKRKIKLLEEKKEEMYERELRRNNVKIYMQ